MTAIDLVVSRLKSEEGFRALPYRDSVGKLTQGYGCNLDAGWSPQLAAAVLNLQVTEVAQQLASYWWWHSLDDVRASVVIDIAFNAGVHGLLGYVKMLAACGAKDWVAAEAELLDSDAARLLPGRYKALGQVLLTGVA
jgi:lysozyme